ncbi:hypothetical protein ACFU7Y_43430 [Kitasatospora sp. NPDC057542]|uniref:hypothetical protein n=1 Tax=unclassified Kitasatospora TaxID=2633591 RepID=UPI0036541B13
MSFRVNARDAVGAPGGEVDHRDLGGQEVFGPFAGATVLFAGPPGVEGGAGDPQRPADPLDAEGAVVVLNETEADHRFVSAAK